MLEPELQIRGGMENNSKIIFLISQGNICCEASLELSCGNSSNEGFNICFKGVIWKIFLELSLTPILIWNTVLPS